MINRFFFPSGSLCLGIILYCPESNVAGDNGLPRRYFVIIVEAVSACAYDSAPYVCSLLGCQQHSSLFCFSERSLGQSLADDGDSCLLALDVSRRHELSL